MSGSCDHGGGEGRCPYCGKYVKPARARPRRRVVRTKPLSLGEEAKLRALYGYPNVAHGATYYEHVYQLLATLDALREKTLSPDEWQELARAVEKARCGFGFNPRIVLIEKVLRVAKKVKP